MHRKRSMPLKLLWILVVVLGSASSAATSELNRSRAFGNAEDNVNRYGSDFADFPMKPPNQSPEICRAACMANPVCLSWTYARPRSAGADAGCWLKDRVPEANRNNPCCISGVKRFGPNGTPPKRREGQPDPDQAMQHFSNALASIEKMGSGSVREDLVAIAVSEAEKAASLDRANPAYWEVLGLLRATQAKSPFEEARAEDELRTAVGLNPANPVSRVMLARVLANRGEYAKAVAQFEEAARQQPAILGSQQAPFICRSYIQAGLAQRGAKVFDAYASARPHESAAKLAHAILLHGLGRNAEALAELASISGDKMSDKADARMAAKLRMRWNGAAR